MTSPATTPPTVTARRLSRAIVLAALPVLTLAAVLARLSLPVAADTPVGRAYVPLVARGWGPEDRNAPPTALPTAAHTTPSPGLPPSPTAAPSSTAAPTEPGTTVPTLAPSPTDTPEPPPTETPSGSRLHGRITVDGEPGPDGLGLPGNPQIELRKLVGGTWNIVDRTVTENGQFEFKNPPELAGGEVYQVWFVNGFGDDMIGADLWLGRWWSRRITSFGPGSDVDLGVFEVANLQQTNPCNDCGQTPPITFKWTARETNKKEIYRWVLYKTCESDDREGFRTQPLGHVGEYTMAAPPAGFGLNQRYCWYVFIEDGQNGTGWTFHHHKVTFLPMPLTRAVGKLQVTMD